MSGGCRRRRRQAATGRGHIGRVPCLPSACRCSCRPPSKLARKFMQLVWTAVCQPLASQPWKGKATLPPCCIVRELVIEALSTSLAWPTAPAILLCCYVSTGAHEFLHGRCPLLGAWPIQRQPRRVPFRLPASLLLTLVPCPPLCMSSSSATGPSHQATSAPASAIFHSLFCSV